MNKDDALVRKFREGDRACFDELYNAYKERIFNFINRKIGDRAVAEELTQEVFINIYLNINRYEPRGLFKAWIYTIASNLAKNELKKRSSMRQVSLSGRAGKGDMDINLEGVLTKDGFSADSFVKNKELKEAIENALKSLHPLYRDVIALCVIEGLSYEEAAKVLKTNMKTISSRLARARKQFIKKIKIPQKSGVK
ncbi:MAG: sigma-70 family RNA polymerase sigma factor [Candidatus Omnitrophica bacterium]|nr:sigma-70 family RNA polymerase sigma factor [Candidatus Omnitrophota bacterium]